MLPIPTAEAWHWLCMRHVGLYARACHGDRAPWLGQQAVDERSIPIFRTTIAPSGVFGEVALVLDS